jgi:hypothetical protein
MHKLLTFTITQVPDGKAWDELRSLSLAAQQALMSS